MHTWPVCCQNPHTSLLHTLQNTLHAHQLSICTVSELQQGFATTENVVITNFTENHRSNSAFPWEQIRCDAYIQDTRQCLSAQDHSSLSCWTGNARPAHTMPQKDTQSSSCEQAAPWADSRFLDMHVSHHPLQKCYWHSLASKEHDCWQPGTQRKVKVFRILWTVA